MRLRLSAVRPGERRNTLGAFLILFGMMIGHALLETARDALFLGSLPASQLPFVYLGIAGIAVAIANAQQRLHPSRAGRAQLAAWIGGAAVITFLFWFLVGRVGSWILYALYIWSGLLSTLLVVRFWTLAGGLFSVTQAKRLFAFVGTGAITGAIVGSAIAQNVVSRAHESILLAGAAIVFAVTAFAPAALAGPEDDEPDSRGDGAEDSVEIGATLRRIWNHDYVRRIAGIVLVSSITFTLGDFVFKSVVAAEFPGNLAYVFATTYLLLNCLALLLQITLVGWVTRNLPIDRVLAFLPALLLVGSGWLAVGGGVLAAFLIKACDGTFRHSLNRTATEVLYVPLTREWRESVKGFIDVVGQRGGQAIASLAFLLVGTIGATNQVIGAILFALCGLWIWLAVTLKRHYFDIFRNTLQSGIIQTRIDYPQLDLASLESLIGALSSPDEREVLAALDLLNEKERVRLVPALILYHPSPRVVVHALSLFDRAGRTDHLPLVERLHANEAPEVRTAALMTRAADGEDVSRFEAALRDESAEVRATALVGLISSGTEVHPRVRSIVETLMLSGSAEAKVALARAIRRRPSPEFDGVLRALSASPDPEVGREVARAMAAAPNSAFIPSLVELLGRRGSREEARVSLVSIGEPAFEYLARALTDETLPPALRRHVPRTISRFPPERAAPVLLSRLPEEPDGVTRFRILRALGYLRTRNPSLKLDVSVLKTSAEATVRAIFHLIDWRVALERWSGAHPESRTAVRELIVELLRHKETLAIERLFRLFSLQYPREDFRRIHRGLRDGRRDARASSRELLDHILPSPIREAVLGILDDIPDEDRLGRSGRFYRPEGATNEDILKALLEQGSVHLRCLVAYHVAELGLREMREDLTVLCDNAVGAMESSLQTALAMLDNPEAEKAFVVPVR